VVRGATRLEDDNRGFVPGEELEEASAGQSQLTVDAPWAARHGNDEDGLGDVDGDGRTMHWAPPFTEIVCSVAGDFGTPMPIQSQEESISSLQRTTGLACGHPCGR
jgi:hypothetical protein